MEMDLAMARVEEQIADLSVTDLVRTILAN